MDYVQFRVTMLVFGVALASLVIAKATSDIIDLIYPAHNSHHTMMEIG
jgi:hypothetical protein